MFDLNRLNSKDFEFLVQSISIKILGSGVVSFGSGPDGGREATFEGKADFPSQYESWNGYWVIQAKYKSIVSIPDTKDYLWVKEQIKKELEKYGKRKKTVRKPDNLIFFTNVILTSVAGTGGHDKMSIEIEDFKKKYGINNIRIISFDDIITYLNVYKDISASFSSFILPSDILNKLLKLLEKEDETVRKSNEYLCRYLENEFKNNSSSKLEHAGKLTDDKINIEKVFIDLYATEDGIVRDENEFKFIRKIVSLGNSKLNSDIARPNRFVLVAGPGYGKSTLSQFLTQFYLANFLKQVDVKNSNPEILDGFLNECHSSFSIKATCIRLPFRILLKEFAGWIKEQIKLGNDYSVVSYLAYNINKRIGVNYFNHSELEDLLQNLSTIFLFDGLDEVPVTSNRQEVLDALNYFTDTLLRRLHADTLIVGTTRPQGYTKEFDHGRYIHLQIADLMVNSCMDYIGKLLNHIEEDVNKRDVYNEIIKRAIEDPVVSRLMKSPLQASIMTILVRSGGEPPRNKFELFTDYYNTVFKREKQKGVERIIIDRQDYIDEIHYRLGFELQVNSESISRPSASMKIEEFEKFVYNYLKISIGLNENDITETSKKIISAATQRLIFIEEIQEGNIGFNIRSLQEYFAANFLMQNTPDKLIADKLFAISTSSYWTNTLMFCIGYLFKYKRYAIDHVESIIATLNGNSDNYGYPSINSICSYGSWISLDIINEAIYRGHPKYENKFSKPLRNLFLLPFIFKHNELRKIPENIKHDFLKEFILEGIESNSFVQKITAWNIYFSVNYNNQFSISSIEKKFPEQLTQQIDILKNASSKNLTFSDFGRRIVYNYIKELNPIEEFWVFDKIPFERYRVMLSEFDDINFRRNVFAYMFIKHFYRYSSLDNEFDSLIRLLFKDLDVSVKSCFIDYFSTFTDDLDFQIIKSYYSGSIKCVFGNNGEGLSELEKILCLYDVKEIKILVEFSKNPTEIKLQNLFESISFLKKEEQDVFNEALRNLNWLFLRIYLESENVENALIKLKNSDFGTLDQWKAFEDVKFDEVVDGFDTYQVYGYSRSVYAHDDISLVNKYFEFLTGQNMTLGNALDLFRILDWAFIEDYEKIKNILYENQVYQDKLIEAFFKIYTSNEIVFNQNKCFLDLCTTLALANKSKILKFGDQFEIILGRCSLPQIVQIDEIELANDVFLNAIEIYKFQAVENPNNKFIYFSSLICYIKLPNYSIITKGVLINLKSWPTENNAKFFLLVYSLLEIQNERESVKKVNEMFDEITFDDKMIYSLLEVILIYKIFSNLDYILLSLKIKINNNYKLYSKYVNVLKTYFESKSSSFKDIAVW